MQFVLIALMLALLFRDGICLKGSLFIICIPYLRGGSLSNSINRAMSSDTVSGCQISHSPPVVSHLLFADSSFLFFKANMEEAEVVKERIYKRT